MKLPWLEPGDPFPDASQAWGEDQPAPGLLAAGGELDVPTLQRAYSGGIFPWFSEGQPILWWSTDPRMVLFTAEFRLHRSLRKTLKHFTADPRCEIRIDTAFSRVIRACATSPREGQSGTWIVPAMVRAYEAFHAAGRAHSVETWIDGELAGGLYCVNMGQAVFGESMFTRATDASKVCLAALVAFLQQRGSTLIDCQQETAHLASMGARPLRRDAFARKLRELIHSSRPPPGWRSGPLEQR